MWELSREFELRIECLERWCSSEYTFPACRAWPCTTDALHYYWFRKSASRERTHASFVAAFWKRIASTARERLNDDRLPNASIATAMNNTAKKSTFPRNIRPPPRFLPQSVRRTSGWCDPHSVRSGDRGLPCKLSRRRDAVRAAIP